MYLMLWKPAKQLIFELFFYSLLKAKRIYSMMMACVCVYIYDALASKLSNCKSVWWLNFILAVTNS